MIQLFVQSLNLNNEVLKPKSEDGSSTTGDSDDEEIGEEESSFGILLMSCLLILALLTAYLIRQLRLKWLHESATSIAFGCLVGLVIRYVSSLDQLTKIITFDPVFFFLVLLPPIIFESGYNMKKRHFFKNILSICLLAFVGTFVSCMIFGLLIYLFSNILGWTSNSLTLLECFAFGSLISATDPVTVLAIFKELRVDINLYSNVFGESVLNDAVAIVLYKSIVSFDTTDFSTVSVLLAFGQFLITFGGSLLCGVLTGLLTSLVFKHIQLERYPTLESAIFITFAYSSYMLAESLTLSGIVSVLFCGITMGHYTFGNLSNFSQSFSSEFFEILATLSETFVFAYLGMAIFSFDERFDAGLIFWSSLVCILARLLHVFGLSFIVNMIVPQDVKIPFNHKVMLWFSGLRGAVAFALSIEIYDSTKNGEFENLTQGEVILTTTLMIVLLTVVFMGGGTNVMLEYLKIKTGDELPPDHHNPNPSRFIVFDREYLIPFFVKKKVIGNEGLIDETVDPESNDSDIPLTTFQTLDRSDEWKVEEKDS